MAHLVARTQPAHRQAQMGLSFFPQLLALNFCSPLLSPSVAIGHQSILLPLQIQTQVLAVTMSGEKRPAPEGFGTSHQLVVKRNKAAENAGTELVKGSSQNGALIQSVCAGLSLKLKGLSQNITS